MTIAERLAGHRVGVTGATGFIGQALLASLLLRVPDCTPVLLARGRGRASAEARVTRMIRSRSAFRGLRDAGMLDAALGRLEVVEGSLGDGDLTLPPIDVLLHVAGAVSFDVPIDEAFRTHVTGVEALYRAATDAGCEHVVHVSTAYVFGRRDGPIPEEPAGVGIDRHAEAAAAEQLAKQADVASRQPARLRRFLDEARGRYASQGNERVAEEAERRRREWVNDHLVDAGRQRARTLGFVDIYTFTKALGEQVAEAHFGDRHLSIVRPTIVESALRFPEPGWIEGFKVADPLIVGLGRGDIPDFPGIPDGVVDVIPVDLVANAILAAAAHPPEQGQTDRLVVGSGARNPLTINRIYELVREHFEQHPLTDRDGKAVTPATWRFSGPDLLARGLSAATSTVDAAERTLLRLPVTGEGVRRVGRDLGRQRRRFDTLQRMFDLYAGYANIQAVFLDDHARRLHERLDPADRFELGFDPTVIDWPDYLQRVHVPAVTAPLRRPAAAAARTTTPLPALDGAGGGGGGILAVFDLDGTVAATNVITTYLRARWHDDRLAGMREALDILRTLPRYIALDSGARDRFLRSFYRRFAGADVAALEELVRTDLHDHLLDDLNPAAVRRIREHRRQDHRTVLITGALRPFCLPLEPLFDTIHAVDLDVDARGIATGHLSLPPPVGTARAAWLRQHAQQTGADLEHSFAYGDSRSDIPLLRAVGRPVAVDPDVGLHRLARRQGWPIARWSSDGDRRPRTGVAADGVTVVIPPRGREVEA